ncbi:MAG: hypothetical protein BZ151_04215 [Desulfobacca sp. 4484_104]|nr:MAG: hypothetical protein BZ151_04215 [Desulfobacca sp. 4484_104]RLA87881.1 MAG: hypothetical protein DRG58_09575 [Deltaproteobacteria bacterium]
MQIDIIGFMISSFLALFSAILVTSLIWPLICLPLEIAVRLRSGVNGGSAWLQIYLGQRPNLQAVVSSGHDRG